MHVFADEPLLWHVFAVFPDFHGANSVSAVSAGRGDSAAPAPLHNSQHRERDVATQQLAERRRDDRVRGVHRTASTLELATVSRNRQECDLDCKINRWPSAE